MSPRFGLDDAVQAPHEPVEAKVVGALGEGCHEDVGLDSCVPAFDYLLRYGGGWGQTNAEQSVRETKVMIV